MKKKHIISSVFSLIRLTELVRISNVKMQPERFCILMYHRLREDEYYEDSFCHDVLGTTVSLFEDQIRYLKKCYNVVPLDRIVAYLNGEDTLPPNAVAITFDDGYKDTYTLAYPVLKKYGLPATVFLTTGFVGTKKLYWVDRIAYIINHTLCDTLTLNGTRYSLCTPTERRCATTRIIDDLKKVSEERKCELLEELKHGCKVEVNGKTFNLALSWDEVREMARNGITFGAHTVNHPIMTRIPKEIAKSEVLESKLVIEREVGKPVYIFAYPHGEPGDFDKEIQNMLETCGFKAACTSIFGVNGRVIDRFALRRLGVELHDTLPIFKANLAGIFPLSRRLKRAFRALSGV